MPKKPNIPDPRNASFADWQESVTNALNGRINRLVSYSVVGGGGGQGGVTTIQNDGVDLPDEPNINIIGDVTIEDDPDNNRTNIYINDAPGGGCPSGTPTGVVVGGYLSVVGDFAYPLSQASSSDMDYVAVPVGGQLHNLYIYQSAAQSNGGTSLISAYEWFQQTSPDTPSAMGFRTQLITTLYPTSVAGTYGNTTNCLHLSEGDSFSIHKQQIYNTTAAATQGWAAEYATDTKGSLMGSFGHGTVAAGTTYAGIYNSATQVTHASETHTLFAFPFTGTVRKMYVSMDSNQPGTGSLVVTLRKGTSLAGMADTALTITVASSGTSGIYTDRTNTVSVTAGDLGSFKIVNNASTVSGAIRGIICEYVATSGNPDSMTGWAITSSWTNQTQYGTFFTSLAKSATEIFTPCPRALTLSAPRLWVAPPSGSPSFDVTYTVRKNGADTTVILTFDETSSDVLVTGTGTATFAKGDYMSLRVDSVVTSGNPEPRAFTCQIT